MKFTFNTKTPRDVYPRMIFRDASGRYGQLTRRKDITELVHHVSLESVLTFIGNLNAIYGDHFYLDINAGGKNVVMVVH